MTPDHTLRAKKKKPCPGCLTAERSASSLLCAACWRKVPRRLRALMQTESRRKGAIQETLTLLRREREEPRFF